MLFNNTIIEIWKPEYKDILDPYTKQNKKEYTLDQTIPASFQNNTNNDTQTPHGEIPNTTYKAYIPLHKDDIDQHSIIRIQGETEEYTINGLPQWYNHLIPHTKLNLELKQDKDLL